MKLDDIARALGAALRGDPDLEISGVASLEDACPGQISLYLGGKYKRVLGQSRASALVAAPGTAAPGFSVLEIERPRLAFIDVIRLFHTEVRRSGVHERATVAPGAVLGDGVFLGANACVGERATVGDGTEIHEGAVIYRDVSIGKDCIIYAGVVVREGTRIGDRVILHAGAVIGADGFGFEPDARGVFRKIPQVGIVVLEDDVEIGANTCIDRAALGETRVGHGTKIDNLCQLGHGVKVGSDSVISGQCGISGSVTIGSHVWMGGNSGIADHVTVGDGVMMAGRTGVGQDVPPGSMIGGSPHTDFKTWRRSTIALYKLARRGPQGAPGKDE